jgi:hypothetical protein
MTAEFDEHRLAKQAMQPQQLAAACLPPSRRCTKDRHKLEPCSRSWLDILFLWRQECCTWTDVTVSGQQGDAGECGDCLVLTLGLVLG